MRIEEIKEKVNNSKEYEFLKSNKRGIKNLNIESQINNYLEMFPDEFGAIYTVDEMIEDVEEGYIINEDGFGDFVSIKDFSKKIIYNIENISDLLAHKDTHFILWYNK